MKRSLLFIIPWFVYFVVFPAERTLGQCPVNAGFSWDNDCDDQGKVYFFDTSTAVPPSGQVTGWNWDFGDGNSSTAPSPVHTYALEGWYDVSLTVYDVSGCSDQIVRQVYVALLPVAGFTHSPDWECADTPVFFDASSSSGDGLTYTWEFSDGRPPITTPYDTITHKFYSFNDQNCSVKERFNVSLTVTDSLGCTSSVTRTVTVIPMPVAALLDSLENDWVICHTPGQPLGIDTLWVNDSVPFEHCVSYFGIDWGDGTDTNNLSLTSFPLYHVYNSYGTFPLTYYVHGVHNCDWDTTYYVEIVSYPTAYVDVNPVDPGCAPYTVEYHLSGFENNASASTYTFDFGDGTPPLVWGNDEMHMYDTLLYTYTQPHCLNAAASINGYHAFLHIDDNGHCGDTVIFAQYVEVYKSPVASFTADHDSVCLQTPICFTNHTIPGYSYGCQQQSTYLWDFGDGTASADISPCHTYQASGVYTVTLTAYSADECYHDTSMTVKVFDNPLASLSASLFNCQNDLVAFTDLSQPGSGSITSWWWDFGDGQYSGMQHPDHIYTSPGIYTVTLEVVNSKGCMDDTTVTVEIWELPYAHFADSSHCSYTAYFKDLSSPNAGAIISWEWDFGDGVTAVQQHPVHTYDTSGVYMVSLIVTNSNACIDSVNYPVIIHPLPVANTAVEAACLHNPNRFTDLSIANYGMVNSWEWDFGDGNTSSLQHPTHTYNAPGTYPVRLIIETTAGCRDTAYDMAEVFPLPEANFTASPICDDYDTYFTDLSIPHADSMLNWFWQFGDGGVAYQQNPHHIYASPGFYQVQLRVENSNGCVADTTIIIEIYSSPHAGFTHSQPTCFGDSVYFYDHSTPELDSIVSWFWQFGDGQVSAMQHPVQYYPAPGNYTATLLVTNTNGCTSEMSTEIIIHDLPVVDFSYTYPCWIHGTEFHDLSSLQGNGAITQWIWDFGDGGTSSLQNPVHQYQGPGNYQVSLTTVTDAGCVADILKTVPIYDGPRADFVADTFCVGNSIDFIDLSQPAMDIVSWYWDFDDPASGSMNNSSLQHPEHTFMMEGNYTVSLTVTDIHDCYHTTSLDINVEPNPLAAFSYSGATCPHGVIEFFDLSQTYHSDIVRWEWDFGDGTTQTVHAPYNPNTMHVYTQTGTYAVSLGVFTSAGCSHMHVEHILVHNGPPADFTYANTCEGQETEFYDNTNAGDIFSWEWDFGDPLSGGANHSVLQDPVHIFSSTGAFNVQLIVTNTIGCTDTVVKTILVTPPPPVDFYWMYACEDAVTQFYVDSNVVNTNTIIYYLWDFGDGHYSNLANPGHVFDGEGTYNVSLHLTDTAHCENSITYVVNVYKKPYAFYDITEPTCIGDSIFLNNMSTSQEGYIERWVWDYDDGTPNDTIYFPNDPNVSHIYQLTGSYSPVLTVTNTRGCSDSYSRDLVVRLHPEADFSYSYPCENTPVAFSDLSVSNGQGKPSTYLWDFGDPASGLYNTSTLQNPEHIFSGADSIYHVSLTIVNFFGCSDTMVQTIFVNDGPEVDFSWSDACEDMITTFYPDSSVINVSTVSEWFWEFGDGSFGFEPVADHLYELPGTYEVRLTISDSSLCAGTNTRLVNVNPAPEASFIVPEITCAGSPLLFDDNSHSQYSYITTWHWDFGDGTDTTVFFPGDPDVMHTYSMPGTYEVVLGIAGNDACTAITSRLVTIEETPLASFDWEGTCLEEEFYFNDLSATPQGTDIISWYWDFDDPLSGIYNNSMQQSPAHTFASAGLHHVSLLIENSAGCFDSVDIPVYVSGGPQADFSFSGNCVNNATFFEVDTAVTNTAAVALYDWDFGDGSPHGGGMDPTHVYEDPGTYTVVLTVYDSQGCGNAVSHQVSVQPGPVALFDHDAGCVGEVTAFLDQSYNPGNGMIIQWYWDFGDPASGAGNQAGIPNPDHTFSGPGLYYVSLVVSSTEGCYDSIVMPVSILPEPEADFTAQVNACSNGRTYFMDGSAGQAAITGWEWTFENGYQSFEQNPVHTFSVPGQSYFVQLIATDERGCIDTIVKEVYIPEALEVEIYEEHNCLHQEMQFSAMIIAPQPNTIWSYSWDFGDPASGAANYSSEAEPLHVFSHPGAYMVSLEMVDMFGCEASISEEVVVHELPYPQFIYTVETCDSVFFFEDRTPIGSAEITRWVWNFGDGSPPMTVFAESGGDVCHTYQEYGVYNVSLMVENEYGCIDTCWKETVYDDCMVPAMLADDEVCQYEALDIHISGTAGPVQQWYLDFGDGADTAWYQAVGMLSHRYRAPGQYTLRMGITAVVNGGLLSDTITKDILVLPAPEAAFSTGPRCVGSPLHFADAGSYPGSWPDAWRWDFGTAGAGDTSSVERPYHIYNVKGTYNVSLQVRNGYGCTDRIVETIEVGLPPQAAFEHTAACVNEPVFFTDRSQSADDPITKWIWNFGDELSLADTSAATNPVWAYGSEAEKQVELVVVSGMGCPDTIRQPLVVYGNPKAGFTVSADDEGQQGSFALEDASEGAVEYFWDFGDGYSLYDNHPPVIHRYEYEGQYLLQQIVWNEHGCRDSSAVELDYLMKALYVPNALNPGSPDPEVAVFKPKGRNLLHYHIGIYNTWGERIWESSALDAEGRPAESWDGYYEGHLVPSDVYVWKVEAMFLDGTVWEGSGSEEGDELANKTTGLVVVVR